MTQNEFTKRTGVEVDAKEFESINDVYMDSDLDKDEFCKLWVKMNRKRVAEAKKKAKSLPEGHFKKAEEAAEYMMDIAKEFSKEPDCSNLIALDMEVYADEVIDTDKFMKEEKYLFNPKMRFYIRNHGVEKSKQRVAAFHEEVLATVFVQFQTLDKIWIVTLE